MAGDMLVPDRLTQRLRARGALNGERVKMARETRGIARYVLARKLGISSKDLTAREQGWHVWEDHLIHGLMWFTDYPARFFTQDDPPAFGVTSADYCGKDWRVCDPCEREAGGHIAANDEWAYRAEDVCSVCGEDICGAHCWVEQIKGERRAFCPRCHQKWATAKTRGHVAPWP